MTMEQFLSDLAREKRIRYSKKYHAEHREQMIAHHRIYYEEHREEVKQDVRERTRKLRLRVIKHYSEGKMCCGICEEERLPCLSIDHIDGRGAEHRRQPGVGKGTGFYLWIVRNNFPEGFQILCMNCQFIKRYEQNYKREEQEVGKVTAEKLLTSIGVEL